MLTCWRLHAVTEVRIPFLVLALFAGVACADPPARQCQEIRRFDAEEATQGVAVDDRHFFAIANTVIGKYDKRSGERVGSWRADPERPLKHLNAGAVLSAALPNRWRASSDHPNVEGAAAEFPTRLWCAHSNFPQVPSTSSVEIWNLAPLEHVATQSFGAYEGSLTWVDWHHGDWWAVFAHYSSPVNQQAHTQDHRATSLVRFDAQWRRLEGWMFPDEVLERFAPHSCSGGSWGPDGKLYVTGHDLPEMYALELPKAASTLRHVETIAVPMKGQAFVFDRSEQGVIYGIDRGRRQVVVSRLPEISSAGSSRQR